MRRWQIRGAGLLVLLALLMIGPYGPGEFAIWFLLLAVVLFAPIPSRFVRTNRA
jgi:hypothetical protein